MIAALYVRPDGPYAGRPDVDAWPAPVPGALPLAVLVRDAREYRGDAPVVAHPPCARWSRLAHIHKHRPGMGLGEDGGCFAAALAAVERCCGVLEHPAGTAAWPAFGLATPRRGSWQPSRVGWVTEVDQGRYGHVARKRTWLYCVGAAEPAALDWTEAPVGERSAIAGCVGVERQAKSQREITPREFADLLIDIARRARGVP